MIPKSFSTRKLFFCILTSLVIFALSACGSAAATEEIPSHILTEIPATQPVTVSTPQSPSLQPALLETRRLTLEFPPRIKADAESDLIRLTLEVDDLGNITPTAFYQENTVTGEVIQIPDLYATHNVGAESRFDIAGLEVQPTGSVYQPMEQGKPLTFFWSIRAEEVGKYRGTIWVHLVFVDRVSGETSRMPISAQIVDIEAVDLFGFSTNFVRTSGVIGSALAVIVGFPFFDDIVKYLWSRRKKRKTKAKTK